MNEQVGSHPLTNTPTFKNNRVETETKVKEDPRIASIQLDDFEQTKAMEAITLAKDTLHGPLAQMFDEGVSIVDKVLGENMGGFREILVVRVGRKGSGDHRIVGRVLRRLRRVLDKCELGVEDEGELGVDGVVINEVLRF